MSAFIEVVVKQLHVNMIAGGVAYIEIMDATGKPYNDEIHGKVTGDSCYTRRYNIEGKHPSVMVLPQTTPGAVITATMYAPGCLPKVLKVEDLRVDGKRTPSTERMYAYTGYIMRIRDTVPLVAYACPNCEFTIHCANKTGDSACICPQCGELHMRYVSANGAYGV